MIRRFVVNPRTVPDGELRITDDAMQMHELLHHFTRGGQDAVYLHLREFQETLAISTHRVTKALENLSKLRILQVGPYAGFKPRKFVLRKPFEHRA